MKGSTKQIEWAKQIVQKSVNANDLLLEREQARYDADVASGTEACVEMLEVRQAIHNIVARGLQELLVNGDAGKIIDYGISRSGFLSGKMAEVPHHDWIRKNFPTPNQLKSWI